jgi:hypothetical protein
MENNNLNGKIYQIKATNNDKCYIGSTIQPLSSRMALHRYHHKLYKEGKFNKVYSSVLFDLVDVSNCSISLIEECPIENLSSRESFWIQSNPNAINKNLPGRTKSIYQKEKITCECGKIVCRGHLYQHKKLQIHIKKMNQLN